MTLYLTAVAAWIAGLGALMVAAAGIYRLIPAGLWDALGIGDDE